MIIELLNKDKDIIRLQSIDEMPKDLSNINSVQIINYSAGYICNC